MTSATVTTPTASTQANVSGGAEAQESPETHLQNLRHQQNLVISKTSRAKADIGLLEEEMSKMYNRHLSEQVLLRTKLIKAQNTLEENLIERGKYDGLIEAALEPPAKKPREN